MLRQVKFSCRVYSRLSVELYACTHIHAVNNDLFTSAKEVMFSLLFVCLSVFLFVSNFVQKLPNGFA